MPTAIETYLDSDDSLDKAGSYAIQEVNDAFVKDHRPVHPAPGRPGPHAHPRLCRARRRQPGRPDRDAGDASGAGQAGESAALNIDFKAKLPRVIARSGFVGDFFLVGQWFPKLGVFRNGAWNCHQYHARSELFAHFGVFKAESTVPESFVVGATGERIGERKNPDGTKTYVHYQEDVHDFAWTACPEFGGSGRSSSSIRVDTEMIFLVHLLPPRPEGPVRPGLAPGP